MKHTLILKIARAITMWYLKYVYSECVARSNREERMGLRLDAMTEASKLGEAMAVIKINKLQDQIVADTLLSEEQTLFLAQVDRDNTLEAAEDYQELFLKHEFIRPLHNGQAELSRTGKRILDKSMDYYASSHKVMSLMGPDDEPSSPFKP